MPQRNAFVVWRTGLCQRNGESTGLIGYLVGQIGGHQNPRSKKAHRVQP
jgi:hypothetical protein